MKKTMNINIAGQLFRIDEDAYEMLTRYMGHVTARFRNEQGGEETVEDIEQRIAEIFGGGNEPPVLISKEMVTNMINIMGAPEDYYDDSVTGKEKTEFTRKSMYDPNSLSARTGKALSEFFRAFGRMMSVIFRVIAIICGTIFTIVGFVLLFASILVLFFNDAPFVTSAIEPEIINTHTLLSIVLSSESVLLYLILASVVIILPLAALTYLGIRLIFNIRERSRITGMIMFITWIAAVCALGVLLSLQLSVYSNRESFEERVTIDKPPAVIWIAPLKKITPADYTDVASIDHFRFYRNTESRRMMGTADLNIFGTDEKTGYISVEKRAFSNSETEARSNARMIDFNWKFSGDTLYLDEYFSVTNGMRWNGSFIDIDISLPEGTEVRCLPGVSLSTWICKTNSPEVRDWKIRDGYLREADE